MTMLNSRDEIEDWLIEMKIKQFIINDDLSVDVNGAVDLTNNGLDFLPIHFRNIEGDFDCSNNKLTTLLGCPGVVRFSFSCDNNNLTSLEYCPQIIGEHFWCQDNHIVSIKSKHLPFWLGDEFYFSQKNQIIELESLYEEHDDKIQVQCSFETLKKTISVYELNQSLQLELVQKSENLFKKSKI